MSLIHYIAVGPGDGSAITQTEDVHYVCDDDCARDAAAARVDARWDPTSEAVWSGDSVTFSDQRPTGDVFTWEYATNSLDTSTSGHEWCWNPECGALVSHGTDDTMDDDGPYVCNGDVCDAPSIRREPVQ